MTKSIKFRPIHQAIHENAHVEKLRQASQHAWAAILSALEKVRSTTRDMQSPQELYDQVISLLRDGGEFSR